MSIKRYRKEDEPFGLVNFKDEIDKLFDNFASPWRRLVPSEAVWVPELDIYEDENSIVVSADLPGMKADNIDVSVSGNMLSISGEKKKEEEKKGRSYYRLEKSSGSFSRRIELPSAVDSKKISASYKDGVLEVTLPKVEKAKPKKVKVQVK
jgi:HSP20 family protein